MAAPRITDAEWLVMETLWAKSPRTAPEVIDALKPRTKWSSKTVHTLINRLVAKKAIELIKDSPLYRYTPLVGQAECRYAETKTLAEKVSQGSLGLLVSNLVREKRLTPEEIDELRRLLAGGRSGGDKQ